MIIFMADQPFELGGDNPPTHPLGPGARVSDWQIHASSEAQLDAYVATLDPSKYHLYKYVKRVPTGNVVANPAGGPDIPEMADDPDSWAIMRWTGPLADPDPPQPAADSGVTITFPLPLDSQARFA